MAHRVRHYLAEGVVLFLRRLRRDSRPGDIYNDFRERVYRPYSPRSEPSEANSRKRCSLIAGASMMDDG